MREIKFRGKRVDNGEWVIGHYIVVDDKSYIASIDCCSTTYGLMGESAAVSFDYFIEVTPETIGQYTGLKDKNGVEIYEGDILKTYHFKDTRGKIHYLEHYVEWSDTNAMWYAISCDSRDINNGSVPLWVFLKKEPEVIGNVHENAELLKTGEQK